MELGLKGKRVLITASSAGIGKATAIVFLEEGASVMINGRNSEKLETVAQELSNRYDSGNVIAIKGDATKPETMHDMVSTLENAWGAVDILVPCVGTGKPIAEDRLDISEWKYMAEINEYAPVTLIQQCIPLLKRGSDPAIVLVSSIVALSRVSGPVAYASAKGALLILTSYLSGMYAETGIRVNAVAPGNVLFAGGRWEELKKNDPAGTKEYIDSNVPMGRFGTPEEIADSIVFLASARSSFTNGAILVVDGGQNRSIK